MKSLIIKFNFRFLLFHSSSVLISSSVPCSQTPSVCVYPLTPQAKFHIHISSPSSNEIYRYSTVCNYRRMNVNPSTKASVLLMFLCRLTQHTECVTLSPSQLRLNKSSPQKLFNGYTHASYFIFTIY
jgi:hypothetical protein